jgi:hypothetical protein
VWTRRSPPWVSRRARRDGAPRPGARRASLP